MYMYMYMCVKDNGLVNSFVHVHRESTDCMNTYVRTRYIRKIYTYRIYMSNVHAVEEMSEKTLTYLRRVYSSKY